MRTARPIACLLALLAFVLGILSIFPGLEEGRAVATDFILMSIALSLIAITDATNTIYKLAKRNIQIIVHEVMEETEDMLEELKD